MPLEDFSIVYQGHSVQADLLKSILEGSGIECVLQDEYVGRMRLYVVPGGVKVLVAKNDLVDARTMMKTS